MRKQLIRTPILFATVLLALPLWTLSGRSGQTPKSFTGEVMDTFCAKNGSHDGMMAKMPSMGRDSQTCSKKCAEIGAKYVLFDKAHNAVYKLNDQVKVAAFVGRRVRVTGMLDGDSINVTNVDALG